MQGEATRLKVLHVDDFDEFLDEFQRLFSPHFDVTSVESGHEALARLRSDSFDAVVLDYDLPQMNGLELLREIQREWPTLPCIFCTGQGSEDVARQALTSGADDYFVKDFSLFVYQEKLARAVRQAVERRVEEEARREERQMLEAIIERNPYSIQIWNRRGYVVRVNQASKAMFQAVPPPTHNIFEDDQLLRAGFGPMFDRVKRGETVYVPFVMPYNTRGVDASLPDTLSYSQGVLFPILDGSGDFDKMVVMHEDVTAKVTAERALEQSRDDLQKMVEELDLRVQARTAELEEANRSLRAQIEAGERLQRELARKNQELEAFAGRVSHDLRNDLVALRLSLRDEPPELQPRLEKIAQRHDRLIEYVQRLLTLSRTGRTISSRLEIAAEPLLRQVFERIRRPQVEAELEVAADVSIPGDPLALDEVFSNLVSNSFQYRDPEKPRLCIAVDVVPSETTTHVTYIDNGIGIPRDNLDRVFDASFTTDRRNHHGLGLAFVHKIVLAHGGTVSVSSEGRGQGTRFDITLPRPRARRP